MIYFYADITHRRYGEKAIPGARRYNFSRRVINIITYAPMPLLSCRRGNTAAGLAFDLFDDFADCRQCRHYAYFREHYYFYAKNGYICFSM